MNLLRRKTLLHDWPVLMMMTLNLAAIGLYLGVGPSLQQGSSYRVINTRTVLQMLDSGELSRHEASWYQRQEPVKKTN